VDIEKTFVFTTTPEALWAHLLDPQVMGQCVPGMQSIDVLSATEYRAKMVVKVSFVSAKFNIVTTVLEQQAPYYLKSQGIGEDHSVASSFKQLSQMYLKSLPDGKTELRMVAKVEVLGRLGTFGLSAMKTKADRLWEEFGVALNKKIESANVTKTNCPTNLPI
jgi:uncharacterized protein